MKKVVVIVCSLFVFVVANAQLPQNHKDVAIITLFNKTIKAQLFGDNHNNKIEVQKLKKGKITIQYTTTQNEQEWIRRFWICDEKENELPIVFESQPNGIATAHVKQFVKATLKGKKYKLYTTATPADAALAATVRVRSVLLTNISIQ